MTLLAMAPEPGGPQMSLGEVLEHCLAHFAHLDYANAAVHTADVRFSPITFRLAELIDALDCGGVDSKADGVLSHKGLYDEDKGR